MYAEQSKMSLEDVKKYIQVDEIKENKIIEKTVEFLVKNVASK